MMSKLKKMITIGICISLVSEIYLNIFSGNFRISFSVIIFSISILLFKDLKIIDTSIVTGIIVFLFRSILFFSAGNNIRDVININYPVIFFYIIYGFIFLILNLRNKRNKLLLLFLGVLACDLIANFFEILIRARGMVNKEILSIITVLVVIALVRSFIIIVIIKLLKYYKLLIIKTEHEERYRRLVLLISSLKSEIYFMKKNADYIENVMKNSYQLYELLSKENVTSDIKGLALSITKDVHEIKKDYARVIKGIENLSLSKIQYKSMSLKDIFTILEQSTVKIIEGKNKSIELLFKLEKNFRTKKHYALISILRNIINNSIEALEQKKHIGKIEVRHFEEDNNHIFRITDNGVGIKESDINIIFKPGFSTKFDFNTGDIYRGIGLSLVNDVVKDYFNGRLHLDSKMGEGTSFKIIIPKENLEE